jgi:predicted RND superfamily exporter protein
VIIGIPNSILLLNKYHNELRKHGDKDKALHVTILRISETTLIANVTAAIGFGVLFYHRVVPYWSNLELLQH